MVVYIMRIHKIISIICIDLIFLTSCDVNRNRRAFKVMTNFADNDTVCLDMDLDDVVTNGIILPSVSQSKDGILAQDNGKNAIFFVFSEYLSLPNDNYFMIFSIVKFVENHIDKYGSPHFIYQNGYKFYTTCHGEKCYNKNVKISLNRRIDPQYALVKFDNKIYQINLQ